jgi:hypothetical protein
MRQFVQHEDMYTMCSVSIFFYWIFLELLRHKQHMITNGWGGGCWETAGPYVVRAPPFLGLGFHSRLIPIHLPLSMYLLLFAYVIDPFVQLFRLCSRSTYLDNTRR